jgi:2-(1,2-epoxy-1,2-dihydrophenyl)acetyl-CoA isomerase
MSGSTVLAAREGGVATLTLNRPEALNALNPALIRDLGDALRAAAADPVVRCVVLTGGGKAFCAGGDLAHIAGLPGPLAFRAFVKDAGQIVAAIAALEKPVIAMVNGPAAGAGFNLALACDIIFAARTARFAQSFAKVGLVPDCGGHYLLPRLVGAHKAKELMFTGDLIDADTALALGLVNRVAAPEALAAETGEFAARLAAAPPVALAGIKKLAGRSIELDLATVLEYEAELQAICFATEDAREGIDAFLAKRPPIFSGR